MGGDPTVVFAQSPLSDPVMPSYLRANGISITASSLLQTDDGATSGFFQPVGAHPMPVPASPACRSENQACMRCQHAVIACMAPLHWLACMQEGPRLAASDTAGAWLLVLSGCMHAACFADDSPKANVLAYGKGYVELKGQTVRVIPHVLNLETCARHCDADVLCTHWRRCAGVGRSCMHQLLSKVISSLVSCMHSTGSCSGAGLWF